MFTTVFLDAGHGGLDPKTGLYTTPPNIGKRFTHKQGVFHNGPEFLEGVKNRQYTDAIRKELINLGVNVVMVSHKWQDNSLQSRTTIANQYNTNIARGIYFSEHSNASNGTARGFSVWTSPGNTNSDVLATMLWNNYKTAFPNIRAMSQNTDGDPDYEANFHVLVHTQMPAVLSENLFFDNFEDATLLLTPTYLHTYAKVVASTLKQFLDRLNA